MPKLWKDPPSTSGVHVNLAQENNRLPRQRYDVRLTHLHLPPWNAPLGRGTIECNVRPLHRSKLDGSRKDVWHQLQCQAGQRLSGVSVDGTQKLADLDRLDDRRHVFGLHGNQQADEIRGYILALAASGSGISQHAAADRTNAMGQLKRPARLDATEHGEQVGGCELPDIRFAI